MIADRDRGPLDNETHFHILELHQTKKFKFDTPFALA